VFTLRQNGCSHKTRTGVHFKSESVFTLGQNTHLDSLLPNNVLLFKYSRKHIESQSISENFSAVLDNGFPILPVTAD
ncbi:hypothetical protein, partial [Rheinheimera soli]|uniref:hypothetical protein n=1 Tax=Rheinheimera soli TaxID=443616 RepID=UPI00286D4684